MRVRVGQPVTVVADALPDLKLKGTVESVGNLFEKKQGDVTYTVKVRLEQTDPRLRWGMTVKVSKPGGAFADFALVVRSDLKGQGLGRRLLQSLISYCQSCGIGELCGETMDGNLRMQRLAKSLGFTVTTGNDRGILDLRLVLQSSEQA